MSRFLNTSLVILSIAAVSFSCQDQSEENLVELPTPEPEFLSFNDQGLNKTANVRTAHGNLAVYSAEYFTSGEAGKMGNIVYFNDRGNKQLDADFAPGLNLDGSDAVTYYVDNNRASNNLPVTVTEAAIDRSMTTWEGVICADLGMSKIPADGRATGYMAAYFSQFGFPFGGSFNYVADVNHAGWMPGDFFDLLAEDGGDFILGVTFTIIFTDENGNPVDTNGDGKNDVAFREIYYNDNFTWNDGTHYDVETIALHEAGHALSQAHFGKAFVSNGNDKLHFAPRAVMNATYSGVQTRIEKTDKAGHCSIWANWPNN